MYILYVFIIQYIFIVYTVYLLYLYCIYFLCTANKLAYLKQGDERLKEIPDGVGGED